MQETIERIRSAGLRVTQPRRAVLAALVEGGSHRTADEVHRRVLASLPGIALPTVYAVLGDLAAAGLIREVPGEGGAMVFDPNTGKHHHLVCHSCRRIVDVDCTEIDEGQTCLERPAASRGWTLDAADVTFRGLCPDCRRKEN